MVKLLSMTSKIRKPRWQCIGASVRGSSHNRTGLPNQDAIRWFPNSSRQDEPSLILAISDGHGSSKSFRSDIGSRIAVEVAGKVIGEKHSVTRTVGDIKKIEDIAHLHLPRKLVQAWMDSIDEHWRQNQVSDEEWSQLKQKGVVRQEIEENPSLAYGATLLAVLVTETFILYIQQGDGDILCVDSEGCVSRPMEPDPRLIANETTSLCTPKGWNDFRIHLKPYPESLVERMPTLILVSTDGYANSYSSEEEFIKIGSDYLQMVQSSEMSQVMQQLPDFLKETSLKGSGDDITLGVIKRIESENSMANQQKKTSRAISYIIFGLAFNSLLAIISLASNLWLWTRLISLQQSFNLPRSTDSTNNRGTPSSSKTPSSSSTTPTATPSSSTTPTATPSSSTTPTAN